MFLFSTTFRISIWWIIVLSLNTYGVPHNIVSLIRLWCFVYCNLLQVPAMVLVCESRSRKWRSASTANISVNSVERCQLLPFSSVKLRKRIIFCLAIWIYRTVRSEEKGSWNLGLQGLWESEGRRCIHIKVTIHLLCRLLLSRHCFQPTTNNSFCTLCIKSTASAVTVRSTIRRLREQTES